MRKPHGGMECEDSFERYTAAYQSKSLHQKMDYLNGSLVFGPQNAEHQYCISVEEDKAKDHEQRVEVKLLGRSIPGEPAQGVAGPETRKDEDEDS